MSHQQPQLNPNDPLHAFAIELRRLREEAGNPTYAQMAARTRGVSSSALAAADNGDHLPEWRTVAAYAESCKADPIPLFIKWERLRLSRH